MSIFNNMFGNNNQIPQSPQSAVLGILENMKASGKLTSDQYNSLIQNQNNPQERCKFFYIPEQTVEANQGVLLNGSLPCPNGQVLHSDGSALFTLRGPGNIS